MIVIGFNGAPHHGKDEAARFASIALRNWGYVAVTDAFASPLKQFISMMLGEKYQQMDKEKPREELAGKSVREALIDLSENHMKDRYGPDVFVKAAIARAKKLSPQPQFLIFPDLGFPVERLYCNIVIKVIRPGYRTIIDSRVLFDDPDFILKNDGSLADLQMNTEALLRQYLLGGN